MPSLVTSPAAPKTSPVEEIIALKTNSKDDAILLIPATSPSAPDTSSASSTHKTPTNEGKSKKKKENAVGAVTNEKKKATKKVDAETKPQPSLMKFFMGGEKKAAPSKSIFSSNAKLPAAKPKSSPKKAAPAAKAKKEVKPKQTPASDKKEKKQKKEKDPNAPKKAKSAYIFFANAKRVTLKEAEPEIKPTDMMKKCGELWKTISEDEKAVYVKMAEEDKARYLSEMKVYEAKAKEEKEKDVEDAMETAMEDAAADASMEIDEEEKIEENKGEEIDVEVNVNVEVVKEVKASPTKKELLKLKIAAKKAEKKVEEVEKVEKTESKQTEEEELPDVVDMEVEKVEEKARKETAEPTSTPPTPTPAAAPAATTTTTITPTDNSALEEKKLKALRAHMGANSSLVENFTIHVTKSSFEFVSPSGKKFRSMKAVANHFEVSPTASTSPPKSTSTSPISSGTRGTPTPPVAKVVVPPTPVDTAKVELFTKKRDSYLSLLLTDPRASKRPAIAPVAAAPPADETPNQEDRIPTQFMAMFSTIVEGSTLTLDELVNNVTTQLPSVNLAPSLVKAQITLLAEHKFYCEGAHGSVWEMKVADLIPSASLNKVVKPARAFRKKVANRARQTSKLLDALQKSPGNVKKIADEEAKVAKFDVEDKEALQKQLEKEKEKQKKEEEKYMLVKVKEEAKLMKLKAKEDEKVAKEEAKVASLKAKEDEKVAKEKAKEDEKLAKEAKLKKQQNALMGFFKKPAKKAEVAKSSAPKPQAVVVAKPTKSLLSEINSCDSHKPLDVKVKEFKGKGKFVSISVMATVFPPGADPTNPFSRVTPYSEPRNMKLWNKKKFLMFDEDERPPYKGTWSKRSNVVTGRRPFGQDKHLNYDYDSEAEWEEEEPGEDIDDEKAEEEVRMCVCGATSMENIIN
ncbi:hypothetical protein TL16_g01701 [Triparma laevis f. inornata]|uniref:HMG box domain-containing protein n=1 Tax=Triparma laevis f. inornata TaxID=1714386 RepID=A0A9W6ZLS7_9STRA|nr:hypothetical protein TL16_g01701 [Triparma laevis f. inornata]